LLLVVNPEHLLELAVMIVRSAADLAVRLRVEGIGAVDTKSTPTDVVTAADKAVEAYVITQLQALRPGDSVLGEESGASQTGGGTGVRWILDPIDGTVNYLYRLPHYAVSLAAEVDGQVLAGVVRNASTGEEWSAIRGEGAWRDGRRLTSSPVTELGQSLVSTGFSYDPARRSHQARVLAEVMPLIRDVRRFGSAAMDLCLVAEGAFDAYFEKGLSYWDHAAGGLIATEAGVQVTGIAGAPPGPQFVLAAPDGIYQQLHDVLVRAGAANGP
jgi:myo-inositol-1(or 4)-monophosphatase